MICPAIIHRENGTLYQCTLTGQRLHAFTEVDGWVMVWTEDTFKPRIMPKVDLSRDWKRVAPAVVPCPRCGRDMDPNNKLGNCGCRD